MVLLGMGSLKELPQGAAVIEEQLQQQVLHLQEQVLQQQHLIMLQQQKHLSLHWDEVRAGGFSEESSS